MFQSAWFIARKDLQYILRERETLLWLFIMPIVFFYFIGTITSGFANDAPGRKDVLAVQSAAEPGFLADALVAELKKLGYDVAWPATDEQFTEAPRRLLIPADFTASVLAGKVSVLEFSQREAGRREQADELRVRRAAYTVLANMLVCASSGQEPSPQAFERLNAAPHQLKVEVKPAGYREIIPVGFTQAIPGTMTMFTMTVLLTSGAGTLVAERRRKVLSRLASAPITRNQVVLGKWLGRLGLGLVQISFAMLAGTLLFKMNWGPDLAMIIIVLAAWGGLCASLALLLGSLVVTEGQAVGVGVLAANVLAALGGCWWPIEITPAWMQHLSKFLPSGWVMDALHKLISFQSGAASVLPHLAALLISSLIIGWVAAKRFRFQ
jgi:ABC-type multidrug transport system permease subunit